MCYICLFTIFVLAVNADEEMLIVYFVIMMLYFFFRIIQSLAREISLRLLF